MTEILTIDRALATRLLGQAQASPEREVCGLISARDGRPARIYPVANVAADPAREFELDPAQQVTAMAALRERGEELLGVYHSHPAAPPVPSTKDIARCGYPEALMFVISLDTKGVLEMRAFRPTGSAVTEIPLQIFL